jgi:hypothetical protein
MKRKIKPKFKAKQPEISLAMSGTETAQELYTKYIATQDPKIRELWRAKYKQEKGEKTK